MQFNTALLHQGFAAEKATGATQTPVYQVSAFAQETPEQLERVFQNKAPGYAYTRIGNPTVASFEQRIAALEHGIGAVACSSGMAAVTLALLNIVQSGDEVVAGGGLFGGTIDLLRDLESFGITTRYVEHVTAECIEQQLTPKTKAVFVELISNPGLEIVDIEAVSDLLHERGVPLLVDSTTATPYLIHPLDHGADIVIHSTSKYINGGGNAISGIIVDGGTFSWNAERYPAMAEYKRFGTYAYLFKLRNGIWRNMGCCLSPMNAFLNAIGLETLGLRMERLCDNARKLAEFLQMQDGIAVNYPTLPCSGQSPLTQKYLGGKGGAILTIRVGSKQKAFALMNHLKYAVNATNIGDVRTLVIHPASTIYVHSTERQRELAGVFEDMIRVSVGIEDSDDLIQDFAQAIETMKQE